MTKRRGFTIVEVMIVSAVIVIIVTGLAVVLDSGLSIFTYTDVQASLHSQGRFAVARMSSDLRKSDIGQITINQDSPAAGTDTISYRIPLDTDSDGVPQHTTNGSPAWVSASTLVVISLDTATSKLLRNDGSNTTALAENVVRVNFIDHAIDSDLYLDEVRLILEIEKADSRGNVFNAVTTSTIKARN